MHDPYSTRQAELTEAAASGGFRWRLIPAVTSILIGSLPILVVLGGLAFNLSRAGGLSELLRNPRSLGVLFLALTGSLIIAAGVFFWRGEWWRGVRGWCGAGLSFIASIYALLSLRGPPL